MKLFYVIENNAPGSFNYVESTISGYCIFTRFEKRAKLFNESEASELVKHLKNKKPKRFFQKAGAPELKADPEIKFQLNQ